MAAPIDPKIKAAALADLGAGEPLKTTAKKYGVAFQTLRNWKEAAGLDPVFTPSVREAIWAEVDLYLLEALQTLRAVLKAGRDEAYLKSHDTSGLAAWHNAVADKVARLSTVEETATLGADEPTPIRRTG